MECPRCESTLTGNMCACGYVVVPAAHMQPYREPIVIGSRKTEINKFVADYQKEHRGATRREACIVYLKTKKAVHMLPDSIKKQSEDEARAEREAIQTE